MKWDLFVSHASEDKKKFVRPLVKKLRKNDYSVWYDELSLNIGDSLRRSIEKGIKRSSYGLVILSHNFFKKDWPQKELDMLVTLEIGKKHKILPIWLDVTPDDIAEYSPILADKIAIKASKGIDNIVEEIKKVIKPYEFTRKSIDSTIQRLLEADPQQLKVIVYESFARLESYVGFVNELGKIDIPGWENISDKEYSRLHSKKYDQLKKKYELPNGIWSDADIPIKANQIENIKSTLRSWIKGKLDPDDVYDFYFLLNEYFDADYLYILFGIPNHGATPEDHKYLDSKLIEIGSRNSSNEEFNFERAYKKVFDKYYGESSV